MPPASTPHVADGRALLLVDRIRLRSCLVYQARKNSRQTLRWPVLTLPLLNVPGLVVCRRLRTAPHYRSRQTLPSAVCGPHQPLCGHTCYTTLLGVPGDAYLGQWPRIHPSHALLSTSLSTAKRSPSSDHLQTHGGTDRVHDNVVENICGIGQRAPKLLGRRTPAHQVCLQQFFKAGPGPAPNEGAYGPHLTPPPSDV